MSGLEIIKKGSETGEEDSGAFADSERQYRGPVTDLMRERMIICVKPFAFTELLARIRVMLRRSSGNISNIYELGDLTVNCDTRLVTRDQKTFPYHQRNFPY